MTNSAEQVIEQTKWLTDVVVGCASVCRPEVKQPTQHSLPGETGTTLEAGLRALMKECMRLDDDASIETTLLIFPNGFCKIWAYTTWWIWREKLLKKNMKVFTRYNFHPGYQFAGSPADDAANYANRSVYPMLHHLLREESIETLELVQRVIGERSVRNWVARAKETCLYENVAQFVFIKQL